MGARRGLVWVALLVVVLALAGCSEDESTSAKSGPKGRLRTQADPICASIQAQTGTLGDDAAKDRDAVKGGLEQLNALSIPSEDETVWTLFVRQGDNLWLALEDVNQAREVNDTARAQRALTRVRELNTSAAGHADKYGLADCARGFGANS